MACPAFLVFTLFSAWSPLTDGKWDFFVLLICISFLLGIVQQLFMYFVFPNSGSKIYHWKYGSCILPSFQVLFDYLSHDIFRAQVSFTTLQALWICSVPEHQFSSCYFGKRHKAEGLLQAPLWLLGHHEPSGNSSSWLEVRVACACPNT